MTLEGLHYSEIWSNTGRAKLGRNFDVTSGRAADEACRGIVEFGYRLSICSMTEGNHAKPWSSWSVAGPSGCKLTSSQQSGIKHANLNIIPYLAVAFIKKSKFTYFSFYVHILDEHEKVVHKIYEENILLQAQFTPHRKNTVLPVRGPCCLGK
jgi:hypothetical protein